MKKHCGIGCPMLIVAVALTLLTGGCSLVNPHIKWKDPAANDTKKQYSLDWSVEYAENAKKAYKTALGNQSTLSSLLGIGLIPLSAVTLAFGILDKSHTDIVWMGMGAASGYAVGSWLYSKPQQKAYVLGYNATSCAIEALLPLHYIAEHKTEFDSGLKDLYPKIAAVEEAISAAKFQLTMIPEAVKDSPEVKYAKYSIRKSQALVREAREVTGKGKDLQYQSESAGRSLKEAVDRISGQVSGVLVETGPDLQALASVIGGLAGSYGQFVKVPESVMPSALPAETKAQAKGGPMELLAASIMNLNRKSQELSMAAPQMADFLNTVATKKPVETLKSCGVAADQIAVPLTIDPPGAIEFAEKKASSAGRVIKGGAAPYAVAFQGQDAEGLSVRQTEPFGPAFVVQTGAKTPAGQYTLYVADRTGNRQFVDVQVGEQSVGTGDAGVLGANAAGAGAAGKTLSGEELKTLADGLKATSFDVGVDFICTIQNAEVTNDKIKLTVEISRKDGKTVTTEQLGGIKDSDIIGVLRKNNEPIRTSGIQDQQIAIDKKAKQSTSGGN